MTETLLQLSLIEPTAPVKDRRRPGRLAEVNPELLPLLRRTVTPVDDLLARAAEARRTQLAAARGFGFGLMFSIPLWAGLAAGARWAFG